MKYFYTKSDIQKIYKKNADTLLIGKNDQLTDLAKYEAKKLGIKILKDEIDHKMEPFSEENEKLNFENERMMNKMVQEKNSFVSSDSSSILSINEGKTFVSAEDYDLVIKDGVCIIPEMGV